MSRLGLGAPHRFSLQSRHIAKGIWAVTKEHLWYVAKALFRDDPEAVETWARPRCDDLEQGCLDGLLATMRAHANCALAGQCADYIDRNLDRMRDVEFGVQGLMVESGVVGARLKQSGIRWTVAGANAIITLRCCVLSGGYEDSRVDRAKNPKFQNSVVHPGNFLPNSA